MKYRPEIDGLRALAVLPVIFFHAGFALFGGGFIGVDVFFVISGYLISTIIFQEKKLNKFSLLTFYERRARRILPALFFVMLFCIPMSWFFLSPNYLKDFGQSLVAVSFFSSNLLFWILLFAEKTLFEILHTTNPKTTVIIARKDIFTSGFTIILNNYLVLFQTHKHLENYCKKEQVQLL